MHRQCHCESNFRCSKEFKWALDISVTWAPVVYGRKSERGRRNTIFFFWLPRSNRCCLTLEFVYLSLHNPDQSTEDRRHLLMDMFRSVRSVLANGWGAMPKLIGAIATQQWPAIKGHSGRRLCCFFLVLFFLSFWFKWLKLRAPALSLATYALARRAHLRYLKSMQRKHNRPIKMQERKKKPKKKYCETGTFLGWQTDVGAAAVAESLLINQKNNKNKTKLCTHSGWGDAKMMYARGKRRET